VWQRIEAPSPTVFRRVDYVFVRAGDGREATAVSARLVLNTPGTRDDGSALWPSDHYGVFAEVALRPASAR
jgi:endonuclease/exonuclease/phosphatase family metal-dependent hydrolase